MPKKKAHTPKTQAETKKAEVGSEKVEVQVEPERALVVEKKTGDEEFDNQKKKLNTQIKENELKKKKLVNITLIQIQASLADLGRRRDHIELLLKENHDNSTEERKKADSERQKAMIAFANAQNRGEIISFEMEAPSPANTEAQSGSPRDTASEEVQIRSPVDTASGEVQIPSPAEQSPGNPPIQLPIQPPINTAYGRFYGFFSELAATVLKRLPFFKKEEEEKPSPGNIRLKLGP